MDTAQHHQVTIDRTNADNWLTTMHRVADDARRHGDRQGAAHLDLLAEDLSACISADWRDRLGTAVTHWEYHMWISRRADGLCRVRMRLRPIHLAA